MTIAISASGIALDGPLVAGEKVAVSVSGLSLAAEGKPTLALLARFPDALLASVELAEDAQTPGTWTGELDTATKQTALFFATARADERRDAALELVSGRASLARLTVPMANSALCPKPDGAPFASPVYVPVPGPPGTGGDPYDQAPEMDGEASAGASDEYARGDHRHPTDTSRASAADVAAIQGIIPATASTSNKLATASDLSGKANDADVVRLTGNQTVAGDKTFTGQVSAADFVTGFSYGFPGGKYISAPEKTGRSLTDAEISDSTTALGAALAAKAASSSLATVATTGDYGDLTNKPTIPDISGKADAASIAPAFSSSSTYAVGDYCTHEGLLYKCTTAVSTAGAWNAAHWTAVAVTDEMGADTPLPFDAEVDYVTFPVGSVVYLGVNDTSPGIYMSATVKLPSSGLSSTNQFVCGNWRGGATMSTQIYVWGANNAGGYNFTSSGPTNKSASDLIGQFGTIAIAGAALRVGTSKYTFTPSNFYTAAPACDIAIGGCAFTDDSTLASPIQFDLSSFDYSGSGGVRDLIPVRVGTVGYLYDKVSGRLFGSAVGSIPLVPGPDKATPTITTPGRIVELTPAIRYSFASPTPTVSGTSATVACDDRAINDFTVATGITSLTITPPAAVTGRARDFFCRVTLTDASLPTVTLSGGTIDLGSSEVAGMTQGVNLLMFTEIASGHWLASRRSAS